jgi:hypothetical protein
MLLTTLSPVLELQMSGIIPPLPICLRSINRDLTLYIFLNLDVSCNHGLGSVVGIATGYGLNGPGIESRWVRDFRTCPDRPWGAPSLLYNGYRVFPGGKERLGRDADPSPPSSAMVMKGYSYTSIPPMGRTACTRVHFTFLPVL